MVGGEEVQEVLNLRWCSVVWFGWFGWFGSSARGSSFMGRNLAERAITESARFGADRLQGGFITARQNTILVYCSIYLGISVDS